MHFFFSLVLCVLSRRFLFLGLIFIFNFTRRKSRRRKEKKICLFLFFSLVFLHTDQIVDDLDSSMFSLDLFEYHSYNDQYLIEKKEITD